MTTVLVLALVIGIVAGLRAMTPVAAVAWFARLNVWPLVGSHLGWIASSISVWVFTIAAIGEIINDKLPATPSRKVPPQFIARIVMGGLSGAVIGAAHEALVIGLLCGAVGAVIGTLGGSAVRGKLAAMFGKDLPAALLEDAVAILLALIVVSKV